MRPVINKKLKTLKRKVKQDLYDYVYDSKPKKILFDHHPKCGGTSLNQYLQANYFNERIFTIDGNNPMASIRQFKALPRRARYSYDLINGHHAHKLLAYIHPERIAITVFRDPVDRIISHYFYAKRNSRHYLYSEIHKSGLTLEEYATSNLSSELRNWYTRHYTDLTNSQAERNPEKSVRKAIKTVLKYYNIVGFLDNFETFAKILQNQAQLRYEFKNKKANKTKDRPLVRDISQSTIQRIKEVNHLDINFYRKIRELIYPQNGTSNSFLHSLKGDKWI